MQYGPLLQILAKVVWGDRRAEPPRPIPAPAPPAALPSGYRSLHTYLDQRYADTVVLTFRQIEDLLGFALPDVARLEREWWANAGADSRPSAQSRSWTQASRTATPNLAARTVTFERTP